MAIMVNSLQNVKFETFDGPLDLLISLLTKNEIDIQDIPISLITEQYIEYIYKAKEMDIDLASEFIVVAAQLIEIKTKSLLPKDNADDTDENDPMAELIERLTEYNLYKNISQFIKRNESDYYCIAVKEPEYFPELKNDYEKLTLDKELLAQAMRSILSRLSSNVKIINNYSIPEIDIPPEDVIPVIRERLFNESGKISFKSLFKYNSSKKYIISTFLAILEMLKLNEITLHQDHLFDDIEIRVKDE